MFSVRPILMIAAIFLMPTRLLGQQVIEMIVRDGEQKPDTEKAEGRTGAAVSDKN